MSGESLNNVNEALTVRVTEPLQNNTIIFQTNKDDWIMKLSPKGIIFNRERFPDSKPDEFSNAIIKILEKAYTVKFEKKDPPYGHEIDKAPQFYYQGKFFHKEEEFWEYVNEFTHRQTNKEDFSGIFDMLKKDVWMNLEIRKTKISNDQLRSILEETFAFVLQKIWKNENER